MPEFKPKTVEEIYADIVTKVISETPITDVTLTSVLSRISEAVALELDETYFQMFTLIKNSQLESTTGADLDARADEFNITRRPAQAATGEVTISDTAIAKIETNVFNGLPGPVAGQTFIITDKTTDFPSTGSLVVGRGTSNVETVAYSSIDNSSADFTRFELSTAFANDHGAEESVILSQGGNRVIPAGTAVQVPADDINPEIIFTLTANATILDGESEVTNVAIVASETGSASNVPAGAIREFTSPPFATATVTNPTQIVNGEDIESDQELRDRIRDTIQTLSKGTSRALELASIGVIDEDTNQRVTSAQNIEPVIPNAPNTLYIDDGNPSGFSPTSTGQGIETIIVSAADGDLFANLDFFPVVPEILIDTTNNIIDFDEGGPALVATLTPGTYLIEDLLTEIKAQLQASGGLTYTVTRNTFRKIKIQGSGVFDLNWSSGPNTATSAAKVLGFDTVADDTGTNTYDAEYHFRRMLLKKNGVDLFPGVDYVLNPYSSEIEFMTPLSSGDQITAGDSALRASIETSNAENYAIASAVTLTGLVTLTQGSVAVSATGGAFTTEVQPGDFIKLDADAGASLTGAVDFTQGSKTITGSGTTFTTEVQPGDFIKLDADDNTKFARVATVDSNVSMTLVSGYTGSTASGAASKSAPWAEVESITDDDNLILSWTYPGAGGAGASSVSTPETLAIIMDGGLSQIINFLPLDFTTLGAATAEEVRDRIKVNLNDANVSDSSGGTKITITSNKDGSAGSVQVVGGTANVALGFTTTQTFGLDAYKYYTGLLQLVQKTINGDPNDIDAFPGVKAAGVQVEVAAPTVQQILFTIDITTVEGVNVLSLIDEVKSATTSYVNSLGIGADVILSEIIQRVQDIVGIFDVEITVPAANIAIADGNIAKVNDSDITVG